MSGSKAGTPVEIFCNDVAGRVLLPAAELAQQYDLRDAPQAEVISRIAAIAANRQVSNSMVAYKLFRDGLISHEMWAAVTSLYRQQWLQNRNAARVKENDRGPSYYVVRRHRLGDRLLKLSRRMLTEGALSPSKAAPSSV
ncbi:ImmA/IrrE family metallo-endopeptidase [Sinorhizobium meliloti]|uniref:ImmA/IrrE family metallo-endopeptidase n=1 Tax=Rhizobium meliloti TaxID=382 RepID=UPI001F39D2AD|nr:hypothetical protein [Sinorhizobium meliloti]